MLTRYAWQTHWEIYRDTIRLVATSPDSEFWVEMLWILAYCWVKATVPMLLLLKRFRRIWSGSFLPLLGMQTNGASSRLRRTSSHRSSLIGREHIKVPA